MTLVQLEYIIALDTYKSFVAAAEHCNVTQPTLSMQIQKLEDLLGVKIFDRSKQPVVPTVIGEEIILQARKVVTESNKIKEVIKDKKGIIEGELRLGVIPTLAPYLLPLFVMQFVEAYPAVRLSVSEYTTDQLVDLLKNDQLDCALMATPVKEKALKEISLFYEPFVAYVSESSKLYKKDEIKPKDLDIENLWLLTEGHCLRSQVLGLCKEKEFKKSKLRIDYQTGSIETLKKMVEVNKGATILPWLSVKDLSETQTRLMRNFKDPVPVREIALYTHRDFVKKSIIEALSKQIVKSLPPELTQSENLKIIKVKL